MDQENVKQLLLQLHECKEDFSVTFSGKKRVRIDGTYYPAKCEIIINDKNFTSDNQIMYTAIHEFAHHLCHTELGQKTGRAHTQLLWATFFDLIDIAEEKKFYTLEVDEDIKQYINRLRSISADIARLQRELGKIIMTTRVICRAKGVDPEDVIERAAQISKKTVNECTDAADAANDIPEGTGCDMQRIIVKQKSEISRAQAVSAISTGKTLAQVKQKLNPVLPIEDIEALKKQQKEIEGKIENLNREYLRISTMLESKRKKMPHPEVSSVTEETA